MVENRVNVRPYVVGIGASAGGLEALESFFKHCPSNTNLSFVVVQHLSPDFRSLMDELLARHTDMKIFRVDKTISIKPNCIYLIPPKKDLSMKGTKLIPSDQDPDIQPRLPIDKFFISMAKQYGSNSVGVILSGTGSDGTRGCAAIKENEGFVIAQQPSSCKFDGMPKSVIKQNLPDKILNPEEMPETILSYSQNTKETFEFVDLENEPDKLKVISGLLETVEGLDFSNYRPSTIARRIERRVKINYLEGLDEYIHFLRSDSTELRLLHGELLIGVTKFFRDDATFQYFETVIVPRIIEEAKADPVIRVWVAGCSTGQEAYSIAICFLDAFERLEISKELKVFATDVDREAIDKAALGLYKSNIKDEIPAERLNKYFIKKDNGYEVKSKIRRSIIFSHHNVVKDPPFTKVHLVTCRNLLIYFQPNLQAKAISLFHFGLRNSGYLFLGKSEALGDLSNEFNVINGGHKVFQKLRDIRLALVADLNITGHSFSRSSSHRLGSTTPSAINTQVNKNLPFHTIYEKMLNDFASHSILIDRDYNLLHTFGEVNHFLGLATGKSTFNVLKMLKKDFSLALTTALTKSIKTGREVLFSDILIKGEEDKRYNLSVKPFALPQPLKTSVYMVSFVESKTIVIDKESKPIKGESFNATTYAKEQISNLESQLTSTRESLQSTIEELETTNEELQSTNEELMSSNEELQSSNEELQSVNEELYTVNTEHQNKIDEVTRANYDIDFLLKSSNIGIIFLDETFKIRRYNKEIQNILNVMPQDLGRSIMDITFKFSQDKIVELMSLAASSGKVLSKNIYYKGISYLVKAVPYSIEGRSEKDGHKGKMGLVLSFVDVSSIKEAKELKQLTIESEELNYIVAHDLRQPLRVISSSNKEVSSLLSKKELKKDEIMNSLKDSSKGIDVLTGMLDALLKYSRIRTRGEDFSEFTVTEVIGEACKAVQNKYPTRSIEIEVGELPVTLVGDPGQIKQLFTMLFENTVEHNEAQEKVKIKVAGHHNANKWEFSVSDNGSGIETKLTKKIFKMFATIGKGNNHHGVGLSLCKRIVDRHGGQIWLKDNNPLVQGLTIIFTIPGVDTPRI